MDKYFEILEKIENEKIDITKLYILSCMSFDTNEENWKAMEYTYDCWIEADTDLDLARLSAIVCDKWEEIQNDEIDYLEIIEDCVIF